MASASSQPSVQPSCSTVAQRRINEERIENVGSPLDVLVAFYPEIFQFILLEDITRFSGVSYGARKCSYSGRWHVPKLYLHTLLTPHHLIRVAPEQVHFIDLSALDEAYFDNYQKLMYIKVKPLAAADSRVESIEQVARILSIILSLPTGRSQSSAFITAIDSTVDLGDTKELLGRLCLCPDITKTLGRYRFQYQAKWEQLIKCTKELSRLHVLWNCDGILHRVLAWIKIVLPVIFAKVAFGPYFSSPLCRKLYEEWECPERMKLLNKDKKDQSMKGSASTGCLNFLIPKGEHVVIPNIPAIRLKLAAQLNVASFHLEVSKGEVFEGARSYLWHIAPSSPVKTVNEDGLANFDTYALERATNGTASSLPAAPKIKLEFEIYGLTLVDKEVPTSVDDPHSVGFLLLAKTSTGEGVPLDFQFHDLRVLETEVLREDLTHLHVLAPFKQKKAHRTKSWSRQNCESLMRKVWPRKQKFPPICKDLLRNYANSTGTSRKTSRDMKLATTALLLERIRENAPARFDKKPPPVVDVYRTRPIGSPPANIDFSNVTTRANTPDLPLSSRAASARNVKTHGSRVVRDDCIGKTSRSGSTTMMLRPVVHSAHPSIWKNPGNETNVGKTFPNSIH
eukprot:GEMP01032967.1.p1 GENE.GEMP01032967.1~~GEMP01032967.1.p1  ORF type:complete len:624 (+),score=100.02 GEMP01032967.1:37-1908(+)